MHEVEKGGKHVNILFIQKSDLPIFKNLRPALDYRVHLFGHGPQMHVEKTTLYVLSIDSLRHVAIQIKP